MPRRPRVPHGEPRVFRAPRAPAGSAATARYRACRSGFGETAVVAELVGGSERREPSVRVARIGGEDERGLLERETSGGQLERTPGERARREGEAHGERAGLGQVSVAERVVERLRLRTLARDAELRERASRSRLAWSVASGDGGVEIRLERFARFGEQSDQRLEKRPCLEGPFEREREPCRGSGRGRVRGVEIDGAFGGIERALEITAPLAAFGEPEPRGRVARIRARARRRSCRALHSTLPASRRRSRTECTRCA